MKHRPAAIWILTGLIVVLAISAVLGGGSMLLNPSGSGLGMTPELLEGSPFETFRIPGLILFVVFGVGSLIAGHGVWHRARFPFLQRLNPISAMHWGWTAALVLGLGQMVWILVQVSMIGYASVLQPLYAMLGAAIAGLVWSPSVQQFLRSRPSDEEPANETRGQL